MSCASFHLHPYVYLVCTYVRMSGCYAINDFLQPHALQIAAAVAAVVVAAAVAAIVAAAVDPPFDIWGEKRDREPP